MPRKFSTHVALSDGLGVYTFGPGDDVPSWAADKVGEHVLESTGKTAPEPEEDVEDDAPETVEEIVAEEQGSPAPAPDFTKPVQRRGPGRPRKN